MKHLIGIRSKSSTGKSDLVLAPLDEDEEWQIQGEWIVISSACDKTAYKIYSDVLKIVERVIVQPDQAIGIVPDYANSAE